MKPPTTYAEWSTCLDRLIANELQASDLPLLDKGEIVWTKGSAERYAKRFSDAYDESLKQCAARLQKKLSFGMGDELSVVKALASVKRTLTFLYQVSLSEPIPEEVRSHLQSKIDGYAKRTQSSLENSAKSDRSGQAAYLMRNNSLLRFSKDKYIPQAPFSPVKSTPAVSQSKKKKRRVIL